MSSRLRRKSRPQADVQIYGGPLHQKAFDGGMNIDSPASEILSNEVAYAENVIFRKYGIEPRPGTVDYSTDQYAGITYTSMYAYSYNPATYTGTYANYRHTVNANGTIKSFPDNPGSAYLNSQQLSGVSTTGTYAAGTGDTTMLPYRRGWLTFTSSKISYTDPLGSFQVNSPNPVHGIADAGSGDFKYRYLVTLSRILVYSADPTSVSIAADRLTAGAEVVSESGTNGKRYVVAGPTSTARDRDYGEVLKATAIAVGDGLTLPALDLVGAFGSTGSPSDDSQAATHFTHVSIYRCEDFGAAGLALGNNKAIYVWVADIKRTDTATPFVDTISDDVLENRISSQNLLLKTQAFTPMPSGSCAEIASGWMLVSDRTNANSPETYLHYCSMSSPENIGYYFADNQKQRFTDGIRALKANGDILSIFCNNSSHICNLTAVNNDLSKVQYIPLLTYFNNVEPGIGIKDWGTLDYIDKNTMIAVCSDGTVRIWDATKWGDDIAYEKVSKEIKKIVPASTTTYARGSVGKYYNGAYYLWYSVDSSDTATTKCLRYGFGKQAGYGWGYYTGWVYPPFKSGVQVIVDNIGVQRLIVMDTTSASNCIFYWAETFTPFTGALDHWRESPSASDQLVRFDTDKATYGAAGTAIASTWKFRDLIGAQESDILIHQESFHKWRPRDESVGYLSGMTVSMSAYKDGSVTALETIVTQPKTGSLKFTEEISGRRIQLSVSTVVGGWRYVGIESHFRSLDKINYATSGDNSSSESTTSYPQYQAELASGLNHWITRRETILDRATGINLTATGSPALRAGPDGNLYSGHSFSSSYYTEAAANTYAADFSLSFWSYGPDNDKNLFSIAGTNPMSVKFTGGTTLSFSSLGTVAMAAFGSGWHHIFIKRVGTTISVYQNGTLKGTITDAGPTSLGGGALTFGMSVGDASIADFRVFSNVKTVSAMDYYYSDVINNAGASVMPMV